MSFSKTVVSGKKILCRVWNKDMDDVLAKTTVKFGTPYFNVKIGNQKRKYKINYNADATIKRDGKIFLYDTDFDNTVGAMRFYPYSDYEVIASDEAYTVFDNNAVKLYVQKGGFPPIYLAIAMIAVIVMAFAMILTVPDGMNASQQRDVLDAQVTALKQDNAVLRQQLQSGDNNG